MADAELYLKRIADRFADPKLQGSMKGFTKNLLFKFTDTQEDWLVRTVDGSQATVTKETTDQPDVTIITTTDVLAGVMDKKINGMTAYMQRRIQTKGPMEDLMKLQRLMF